MGFDWSPFLYFLLLPISIAISLSFRVKNEHPSIADVDGRE